MKKSNISDAQIKLSVQHRAELLKELLFHVAPEEEIVGLEIGVYKGELLDQLLTQMPKIKYLYGIDPWAPNRKFGRRWSQEYWNEIYFLTLSLFEGRQVSLLRGRSHNIINQVPSGLHFIEIDGEHTYEQVLIDIAISEPKIKVGGLLCGHDYYGGDSVGVRTAVNDYASTNDRKVNSIESDVGMWWWYV